MKTSVKDVFHFCTQLLVILLVPLLFKGNDLFELSTFLLILKSVSALLVFTNILLLSRTYPVSKDKVQFGFNIIKSVAAWVILALFFHVIIVLMGAPAFELCSETLHLAFLMSTCAVLPCCLVVGADTDTLIILFTRNKSEPGLETVVKFGSIAGLLGTWLGAFPIPLDWDRPWQVWPISCALGTLGGYLIGLTVGILYSLWLQRPRKKRV